MISIFGLLTSATLYDKTLVGGSPADQGFIIDTLARDLVVPWQIVFLPDNSMLFTERPGRVRIYRDGKLLPKPAYLVPDIPLRNKSGLLGMCIHPDFTANQFVYVANNYIQISLRWPRT
ncbi:PQQ-dependent sugar dehydrogenase [Hufsiella ginkgonis]|uniref:Glucose/Sorbosone dehydrogenase domain-containing protein n=1 Tax=Hufsiella ginkgonis TaxID=2695274 RepID=A0A7K1Y124_9SPHI|nr:PQQ-dependent sugar dehydrogenase [Hufsiella ginkgonis]MXV16376.1 hypothetical protein [Hufsiella ginkgonis]